MRVKIRQSPSSPFHIEDVQRHTVVEFTDSMGNTLFQVSVDANEKVPTLRVRAVEGTTIDGVYYGNALDIRPEVANTITVGLRCMGPPGV